MIASIMYGFALTPPSTPISSVRVWPMVKRLTYCTMSFIRYRKKITPTRNARWSYPVTMCVLHDFPFFVGVRRLFFCARARDRGADRAEDDRGRRTGDSLHDLFHRGYGRQGDRRGLDRGWRPTRQSRADDDESDAAHEERHADDIQPVHDFHKCATASAQSV